MRSEMLRIEIAKNADSKYVTAQAAQAITPRLIKAMNSCNVAEDEASAESSVNFFNEYREILHSTTEKYSDEEFASSSPLESLNVSFSLPNENEKKQSIMNQK